MVMMTMMVVLVEMMLMLVMTMVTVGSKVVHRVHIGSVLLWRPRNDRHGSQRRKE